MTTNTARYALELFSVEDDTYALRDATTGELVMMASGEAVYAAPLENAMWTADTMNRAEARKSAPAPEPTPEPEPEPIRPNPAALLHVMAHAEPVEEPRPRPVISAMTSAVLRVETETENLADWERELLALPLAEPEPTPVVRPVEKVDYPRMAGKAIGSIGVLSGRLASIGRWLDALEDGSVSPEFAMRQLRQLQTEAHKYAEDIYEELSAR